MLDGYYYLWLHIDQLARERANWRVGLDDEQDAALSLLEIFAGFAQDPLDEDSYLSTTVQPEAAEAYGLQNGERIPAERLAEICRAADFERGVDALLDQPPQRLARHVEEARGAVLGRITRIEHGLLGPLPSLLLELDVEDTLIFSDYSQHPYLVVPTGGYVHDDTVYCSWPGMEHWLPTVGQRLIAMPVTGPWDKDGDIMPIFDPVEIFLVGESNDQGVSKVAPLLERESVPKTLLEFRHRLWDVRDKIAAPR